MKHLLLTICAFIGLSANAQQPGPSDDLIIDNQTDCIMYVRIREYDAACSLYTSTVTVSANSSLTVSPSVSGTTWFEAFAVSEDLIPNTSNFFVKVMTRFEVSTGSGIYYSYCNALLPDHQVDHATCQGQNVEATTTLGSQYNPKLVIRRDP